MDEEKHLSVFHTHTNKQTDNNRHDQDEEEESVWISSWSPAGCGQAYK